MSDDRKWLAALQADLWPESHKDGVVSLIARRKLTKKELARLGDVLASGRFVVEMVCTNMFGGVGVRVHAHEQFPGTGAEHVLTLTQDHLPSVKTKPSLGAASDVAWKYFAKFAHTKQQKAWCKEYDLNPPKGRGAYDY